MEDRFRFRVWYPAGDRQNAEMNYHLLDVGETWIPESDGDPLIWMMCTGLRDKNNQLIYEGDIVGAGAEHATIVWHKFAFQALQGWEQEGRIYQTLLQLKDDMILEVIGNIYENTELLQKAAKTEAE